MHTYIHIYTLSLSLSLFSLSLSLCLSLSLSLSLYIYVYIYTIIHTSTYRRPEWDVVDYDLLLAVDRYVAADAMKEVSVWDTIQKDRY